MLTETIKIYFHTAMDIIYPPVCCSCNAPLAEGSDILCPACWQQLQQEVTPAYCPACGSTASVFEIFDGHCHCCQGQSSALDFVVRVGEYDSVLSKMVVALKYHNQSHLDRFLGQLAASSAISSKQFRTCDMMIPIPLHWRRRFARGYNQSELLAVQTAKCLADAGLNMPVCLALTRIRNTPPQTTLTQSRRRDNIRGAFSVRQNGKLAGKNICLVDDVTTSGATLQTAAKELKKAGAATVGALVICVPVLEK